jgi:Ca-activated chloride channel homolog
MNNLTFLNPDLGWYGLIVGIGLGLAIFVGRGSRYLKIPLLIVRSILLVVLCAILAHPVLRQTENQETSTLLVDISSSMNPVVAQDLLVRARQIAREIGSFETIAFARHAAESDEERTYEQSRQELLSLDLGATDLIRGIQTASQLPGGSIFLITDGYATEGDEADLLNEVRRIPQRIFPIMPTEKPQSEQEILVTSLEVPLRAPARTVVPFRSALKNSTAMDQRGTIIFKHGGKAILERKVVVPAGKEVIIEAKGRDDLEGIQEVNVTFTPQQKAFSPSSISRYISHGSREKVLLLSGSRADHKVLPQVLIDQAYQLVAIDLSSGEKAPRNLKDFSAVIFNNVSLSDVGSSYLDLVAQFVEGGGGFIMVGGNKSFGLGGYRGTVMEDVLPVKLLPPRTEKKRLNVAVSLVLDKSSSMAPEQKLDFAKLAAQEVIRNLKDDDYVGVMGFDSTPFVVVRLDKVGKIRDQAIDKVNRLFPAGRTNLLPAIDEARRSLDRAEAGRKHIIILTDGKLPDAGPYYLEIVRQMRTMGVTVSTVLLGSGIPDDVLQAMAQAGGGSFYQTANATNLPRIFLQDVKINAGEQSMKESQEYVVRRGSAPLTATSLDSFPPLEGFIEVGEKEGGRVELVARGVTETKPLLASGVYGQGKVVAFTSDANGRWSSNWVQWSKFYQFWSELLSAVRGEKETGGPAREFDVRSYVKQRTLYLEVVIYGEVKGVLKGSLINPVRTEERRTFQQQAPGRYLVEVPKALPGKYELQLSDALGDFPKVALSIEGTAFGEQSQQGFNTLLLAELAKLSNGRVNPELRDLRGTARETYTTTDLRIWFFAIAFLLFLVEIVLREIFALARRVKSRSSRKQWAKAV